MMDLIFRTKGSVEKAWVFEAKTCVLIQAPPVNACMTLRKLLNTNEPKFSQVVNENIIYNTS